LEALAISCDRAGFGGTYVVAWLRVIANLDAGVVLQRADLAHKITFGDLGLRSLATNKEQGTEHHTCKRKNDDRHVNAVMPPGVNRC